MGRNWAPLEEHGRQIVGLKVMLNVGALFKKFQRRRILVSGLEAILVIFWQRMWLPFAIVQEKKKICLRLN